MLSTFGDFQRFVWTLFISLENVKSIESMSILSIVVFFDQLTSASHAVCSLKIFFSVFTSFSVKKWKKTEKVHWIGRNECFEGVSQHLGATHEIKKHQLFVLNQENIMFSPAAFGLPAFGSNIEKLINPSKYLFFLLFVLFPTFLV